MTAPRRTATVGLSRQQAGWIALAWFLFGVGAILVALVPLQHDLRRAAEQEMLVWLEAEGAALRPLVAQSERGGLGGSLQWPIRRDTRPERPPGPRYADQAQLWLVSALEREPGLIIPIATGFVAPSSLRDFSRLQTAVAAARGSATRPLVFTDGPEGRQVVAYLHLVGTGYGISASMQADLLYHRVPRQLFAIAAAAVTLLAGACAGLLWLIVAPASVGVPAAAPAATDVPAVLAAPTSAEASRQRLAASLQRVLYHVDTLEHEVKAHPRLREHLAEIRETARQGLADVDPKRLPDS